ncbi:hypothetical protein CPLU01_12000 [Colletotrichum plurivorum]|uniref:Fungal calcium binding protein domain-containing protein n=1 Tax=Colletotrichum plurivorum TaxID=2175906 RepID=A0A8H6K0F1_9PEZI|nr:hypothetical protein CPLU01_12000 [Colletotrichum plurivorum]
MQFSTVFAVLASIATVHGAAVAEPHVREVASLMARQRDCASIGAKSCSNTVSTVLAAHSPLRFCSGGNLPGGGCCACT